MSASCRSATRKLTSSRSARTSARWAVASDNLRYIRFHGRAAPSATVHGATGDECSEPKSNPRFSAGGRPWPLPSTASAQDAAEIVRAAIDNWRGESSYGEMTMTIHRPTWERTMSMRAWTQGRRSRWCG